MIQIVNKIKKLFGIPRKKPKDSKNLYCIFFQGRTGSSYLTSILKSNPHIHAEGEIFHRVRDQKTGNHVRNHSTQEAKMIFDGLASGECLSGWKFKYPSQWEWFPEIFKYLLELKNYLKVIHLTRRNYLKRAISQYNLTHYVMKSDIAAANTMSGKISKNFHVDVEQIIRMTATSQEKERLAREKIEAFPNCLEIDYDDLVNNLSSTLQRISKFLNVPNEFSLSRTTTKITPHKLSEAVSNYDELKQAIGKTRFKHLLDDERSPNFSFFVNQNKNAIADKRPKASRVALLACARNEGPYLLEWVCYHKLLGFDDIYLYSHDNSDGSDRLLEKLDQIGLIHYVDMTGSIPDDEIIQFYMYSVAIKKIKAELKHEWLSIIDLDEFINLKKHDSIQEFVDSYPKSIDGIEMHWQIMSSNGKDKKEKGLVLDRFTQLGTFNLYRQKTIARINSIKGWKGAHRAIYKKLNSKITKLLYKDPSGKEVNNPRWVFSGNKYSPSEVAVVNHYSTKSKEEFFKKLEHGGGENIARDVLSPKIRRWKMWKNCNVVTNGEEKSIQLSKAYHKLYSMMQEIYGRDGIGSLNEEIDNNYDEALKKRGFRTHPSEQEAKSAPSIIDGCINKKEVIKTAIQTNIFILCHNESVLLPLTVQHYKRYLPNCKITIYDNESTDESVQIAQELGCEVISWSSDNRIDDYKYREIKNNCWKHLANGWVIVCDMDEWLCATERDLIEEEEQGTSVLRIEGYNMIGDSDRLDLGDIDIHSIVRGTRPRKNSPLDKRLCFRRDAIKEMNYALGAHDCKPIGKIHYSKKVYIQKHMDFLGLPYVLNKLKHRRERSKKQRLRMPGLAGHYRLSDEQQGQRYMKLWRRAKRISTKPYLNESVKLPGTRKKDNLSHSHTQAIQSFNTRIYQIGFHKAGTRSLHMFFLNNGIQSTHQGNRVSYDMFRNHKKQIPLFTGWERFQAFTDLWYEVNGLALHQCVPKGQKVIPWVMEQTAKGSFCPFGTTAYNYFKIMYEEDPNAIFILNIRPLEDWIESRCNHMDGAYLKGFQKTYGISRDEVCDRWRKEFNDHVKNVKDFFQDKGNLLTFDISKHAGGELANYLSRFGIDCDPKLWGQFNKTPHSRIPTNRIASGRFIDKQPTL